MSLNFIEVFAFESLNGDLIICTHMPCLIPYPIKFIIRLLSLPVRISIKYHVS